jgi:hypothetical protein
MRDHDAGRNRVSIRIEAERPGILIDAERLVIRIEAERLVAPPAG